MAMAKGKRTRDRKLACMLKILNLAENKLKIDCYPKISGTSCFVDFLSAGTDRGCGLDDYSGAPADRG